MTPRWSATGCASSPPTWACAAWSPPAETGPAPRPALAMGSRGFHCGVLWRGDIEPVPGSLRTLGRGQFWHSLAAVTLEIGRPPDPARRFPRDPVRAAAARRSERAPGGHAHRPPRQPPAAGRGGLEYRVRRPGLRRGGRPLGPVRAAGSLRGRGLVRRHDLPVRMGLRRARRAAALGRPAARRRAVGRRPARRGRGAPRAAGSPPWVIIPTTGTGRPGSPAGSTPSGSPGTCCLPSGLTTSPTPRSPGPRLTTCR